VARCLAFLSVPEPATMFQGVRCLRPGHALEWSAGRVIREWCYTPLEFSGELHLGEDEAIEAARATMAAAVRRQLVSDVPVGALLSGGIDSSAVVACAREDAQVASRCFTIQTPQDDLRNDPQDDDEPYAIALGKHLGLDVHRIRISPDIMAIYPKVVYHMDEPLADPAAINTLLICQAARAADARVVLSGQGGDEILAGYRRYILHAALGLPIEGLPRWVRRAGAWLGQHAVPVASAGRLGAALRRARRAARDLQEDWAGRAVASYQWSRQEVREGLFQTDFLEASRITEERVRGQHMEALTACNGLSPLRKLCAIDMGVYLPGHNLHYSDRMSMAVGVELRVPLLDLEFVKFCLALPDRMRLRGFTTKYILRKAMDGMVPAEILRRPKAGFGAPIRSWLRGPMRELLRDLLSAGRLRKQGIFIPAAVHHLIDANERGEEDHAYVLWALLTFQMWSGQYLEVHRSRVDGMKTQAP